MQRAFPLLLVALVPASVLAGQPRSVSRPPVVEYTGSLQGEPVVETRQGLPLRLAAAEEASGKLPSPPAPGARVFAGSFQLPRKPPAEVQVVMVEPAGEAPFLYADLDLDGRLSAGERAVFRTEPDGRWEAALFRFPLAAGGWFPVSLGRFTSGRQDPEGTRSLIRTRVAYVPGKVRVEDREVLVRYPMNPDTGRAEIHKGALGMDLDGSGTIDRGLSPGEVETVNEAGAIFQLGKLYLSTRSVDPGGRIVLRTHSPSEYHRFDLRPGASLPDFAFTDLEGRQRRLSELRGKVVLLDFWGTWCGACIDELPRLREAYKTWRGKGFEILGMDFADELDVQKAFLAENELPWLHATAASVADLVDRSFRVRAFPTKILLDREGRIVSVGDPGQPPLREEELLKTVEAAVSAKKKAAPAR
ncbi:MAG TPA: TlpA disulfide reductase family protein [Thermoanaerobaculia bacterium]|nr:TlpA disulfide reductase family protein [Thermoanaerobaculia bacterium]